MTKDFDLNEKTKQQQWSEMYILYQTNDQDQSQSLLQALVNFFTYLDFGLVQKVDVGYTGKFQLVQIQAKVWSCWGHLHASRHNYHMTLLVVKKQAVFFTFSHFHWLNLLWWSSGSWMVCLCFCLSVCLSVCVSVCVEPWAITTGPISMKLWNETLQK